MAPLHVDALTVQRELPKYEINLGSLPYLCTKNETMAPLHVDALTVQRGLPSVSLYVATPTAWPFLLVDHRITISILWLFQYLLNPWTTSVTDLVV